MPSEIFKFAGGEVLLWVDPNGVIMLKTVEPSGDPVELTGEEALELSVALQQLADGGK